MEEESEEYDGSTWPNIIIDDDGDFVGNFVEVQMEEVIDDKGLPDMIPLILNENILTKTSNMMIDDHSLLNETFENNIKSCNIFNINENIQNPDLNFNIPKIKIRKRFRNKKQKVEVSTTAFQIKVATSSEPNVKKCECCVISKFTNLFNKHCQTEFKCLSCHLLFKNEEYLNFHMKSCRLSVLNETSKQVNLLTEDSDKTKNKISLKVKVININPSSIKNVGKFLLAKNNFVEFKENEIKKEKSDFCDVDVSKVKIENGLKNCETSLETQNIFEDGGSIRTITLLTPNQVNRDNKDNLFNLVNKDNTVNQVNKDNQVNQDKTFKCTSCPYVSTVKCNFIRHVRTHTGEKPYLCCYCDYKCVDASRLRRHKATHLDGRPFQCENCDFRAARKVELDFHFSEVHVEEVKYACPDCHFCTNDLHQFAKHSKKHKRKKKLGCGQCPYRTNNTGHLQRHYLIHSGEKKYQCSLCSYKTYEASRLQKHSKTHSDARPFECQQCHYTCKENSDLTRHALTHSNLRPYICAICPYRSRRKGDLNKHLKIHS